MIPVTSEILDEMVSAIVEAVQPDAIILFGSRAGAAAHEDSDVDLLIVEGAPFVRGRSRSRETDRIRAALSRFRVAKDVLVYSKDEVEKWRHSLNHIIARILREGKVLYARS